MAENQSLDDYIKNNPEFVKNVRRKTMVPTTARFGSQGSQQWRLGRNGPHVLKRLARQGPLRPFQRMVSHPQGMPRLVNKMYARFHPHRPSVFTRLGWNPMFSLARQRVRQARHHFWRQKYYSSRVPLSFPMGRRLYYPVFRPNFHRKRFWQSRFKKVQRSAFAHPNFSPDDQNLRNDQLIKNERRRVQEGKLKNIQNNYMEGAQIYRGGPCFNKPALPNNSSAGQYPIPRDEYASNVPAERAPSPEGSIISALGRPQAMSNPFVNRPMEMRQVQQMSNPFVQAQRDSLMGTGQAQTSANPFRDNSMHAGQSHPRTNAFGHHNNAMGNGQSQPRTNAFGHHNSAMGNGQSQPMTNAFAQRNNGMGTGHSRPHPYVADFRPTPESSSMPLNDRFPRGDGYSRAHMHSSMMA